MRAFRKSSETCGESLEKKFGGAEFGEAEFRRRRRKVRKKEEVRRKKKKFGEKVCHCVIGGHFFSMKLQIIIFRFVVGLNCEKKFEGYLFKRSDTQRY